MRSTVAGFTIIELLVVITIIMALLALLMPALDKALIEAVKTQCAARQHGIVNFCNLYAVDNKRVFPMGKRQQSGENTIGTEEDVHWVHKKYFVDQAILYGAAQSQHSAAQSPDTLFDPNLMNKGYYNGLGFTIGYQYLGGHPFITKANKDWESPISLGKPGSRQMIACENRSVTGSMAWIAHFTNGESTYSTVANDRMDADEPPLMNSAGGNIGHTDGDVVWTPIEEMKKYDGYGHNGSTPEDGFQYPGYW